MRLSRTPGGWLWQLIGRYPDWTALVVGPGETLLARPLIGAAHSATTRWISLDPWIADTISHAAWAVLVVTLIVVLGWLRPSGLTGNMQVGPAVVVLALLPMLAAAGFAVEFGVTLDGPWASDWFWIIAGAAAVALAEEAIYRGVLISVLRTQGPLTAVGLSATAFALSHVTNELILGNPVRAVLQGLSTFGMGSAYGAARLRSGTIWPGAIGHTANNVVIVLIAKAPATTPIGLPLLILLGSAAVNTAVGLLAASRMASLPPVRAATMPDHS